MTATEPTGAVQPEPARQTAPATTGLDPKVGGLLAYLLGWIGGLVIYFTQKDPEVRFHGAQSVLFAIAAIAAYFAAWVLWFVAVATESGILIGLGFLAFAVLGIGAFVLWIVMCVKGYHLAHFKLPVIGDMAERWAAK